MDPLCLLLLKASLLCYGAGAAAALAFLKRERLANAGAFSLAIAGGVFGLVAASVGLGFGQAASARSVELLPSMIPNVHFGVKTDPLGLFFVLLISVLGIALSVYSLGYVRGFYGRKNVGVLAAFYNVLLLATTLVFVADNAFFFLIAWEIMALSAYCLVSFEHELPETRRAGVLYFVMSHIGTGCLILGFLLLFQASGNYSFAGFREVGPKLPVGVRSAVFLLFLAGFGIKAGMVPLHIWLPAAHPVAPSNISALMSGGLIKNGIY